MKIFHAERQCCGSNFKAETTIVLEDSNTCPGQCGAASGHGVCDIGAGECLCCEGWSGPDCQTVGNAGADGGEAGFTTGTGITYTAPLAKYVDDSYCWNSDVSDLVDDEAPKNDGAGDSWKDKCPKPLTTLTSTTTTTIATTTQSRAVPFDCETHQLPIQVLLTDDRPTHYQVVELDVAKGTFATLYELPLSMFAGWTKMNSVSINPVDGIAYATFLIGEISWLGRFSRNEVDFVAKLSVTPNSATFDSEGNYYFDMAYISGKGFKDNFRIWKLEGVDKLEGFKDRNADFIADFSNMPATASAALPDALNNRFLVHQPADLAPIFADYEVPGTFAEYLVGVFFDNGLWLYVSNPETETFWFFKVPHEKCPDELKALQNGIETFGAGWTYDRRMLFSANSGAGIFEVTLDDLEKESASIVYVGPTIITGKNDGMNCLGAAIPYATCAAKDATLSGTNAKNNPVTNDECGAGYFYNGGDRLCSSERCAVADGGKDHDTCCTKVTTTTTTTTRTTVTTTTSTTSTTATDTTTTSTTTTSTTTTTATETATTISTTTRTYTSTTITRTSTTHSSTTHSSTTHTSTTASTTTTTDTTTTFSSTTVSTTTSTMSVSTTTISTTSYTGTQTTATATSTTRTSSTVTATTRTTTTQTGTSTTATATTHTDTSTTRTTTTHTDTSTTGTDTTTTHTDTSTSITETLTSTSQSTTTTTTGTTAATNDDDDDFTGGLCFDTPTGEQVCDDSDGKFPVLQWGAPLLGPVKEDSALGTVVTTLPMPTIDGSPMSFGGATFSVIDTGRRRRNEQQRPRRAALPFGVDAATGAVTVDAELDFETQPSYVFTVGVTGNRRSDTASDGEPLDPLPFAATIAITIDLAPVACPVSTGFSATGTFPCMVYTVCEGGTDVEIYPPTTTTDRVCTVSKSNVPGVAEAAQAAAVAAAADNEDPASNTAASVSSGMVAGIIIGIALAIVLVALVTKQNNQSPAKDAIDDTDPRFAGTLPLSTQEANAARGFNSALTPGAEALYETAAAYTVGREYMDAAGIAAKQANDDTVYAVAASGEAGNPIYALGTNPPLYTAEATYDTAAPSAVHGEELYAGDALYSVAASGAADQPVYDVGTTGGEPTYDMGAVAESNIDDMYAMADSTGHALNPLLMSAGNEPLYSLGSNADYRLNESSTGGEALYAYADGDQQASAGAGGGPAGAAEALYALGAAAETAGDAMYDIARINSVKAILLGGGSSRRGSSSSRQHSRRSSIRSFGGEVSATETNHRVRPLSQAGRSSSYGNALDMAGADDSHPTYQIAESHVRLSTNVNALATELASELAIANVDYDVADVDIANIDDDMMNSATLKRQMDGSGAGHAGRAGAQVGTSGSNAPVPHVYDMSAAAPDPAYNAPAAVWEALEVHPETGASFRIKSVRRNNPLMPQDPSTTDL